MAKKKKKSINEDAFDVYSHRGFSVFGEPNDPPSDRSALSAAQVDSFEEQQRREYELNSAIHRALSTADGIVLFEFMEQIAIRGARFDIVNDTDAALAAAKGFFREGQAAFYFECEKRMRLAMDGPPDFTVDSGTDADD